MMKLILKDMDPDDWLLGVRAAKWLLDKSQKDAVIAYGDEPTTDLYVRRNSYASITVRPACGRDSP